MCIYIHKIHIYFQAQEEPNLLCVPTSGNQPPIKPTQAVKKIAKRKKHSSSTALRICLNKARGAGLRSEHSLHETGNLELLYLSRKAQLLLIMEDSCFPCDLVLENLCKRHSLLNAVANPWFHRDTSVKPGITFKFKKKKKGGWGGAVE